MSFWERIKQILDAIAYFGGLATGISVLALVVFIFLMWLDNDDYDDYDEEIDEYLR